MKDDFVELPYPYTDYVIRRDGLVINQRTGESVELKKGNNTPYIGVTLRKDDDESRSYTAHLHRLLAIAFVENHTGLPIEKLQVNHIDGNKLNNDVDNLEWVTQADNIRHAYATGLQRHENKVKITSEDGQVFEFKNQKRASEFLHVNPASLSEALNSDVRTKCAGYTVERVKK